MACDWGRVLTIYGIELFPCAGSWFLVSLAENNKISCASREVVTNNAKGTPKANCYMLNYGDPNRVFKVHERFKKWFCQCHSPSEFPCPSRDFNSGFLSLWLMFCALHHTGSLNTICLLKMAFIWGQNHKGADFKWSICFSQFNSQLQTWRMQLALANMLFKQSWDIFIPLFLNAFTAILFLSE